MPERAENIVKEGGLIKVSTDKNEYSCRALVVTTGKRPRELNVEGEREFKNRGVTYCATCDGPLFKDKEVAVIGGGNSALDAALQMVKISPKVYIINVTDNFTGDSVMIEKLKEAPNVQI